jgi:hypothetical protein
MEVSGHLYILAALLPGKEALTLKKAQGEGYQSAKENFCQKT